MNYLAHALLSQPGELSLLGNLSGDHVKGPLPGWELHPDLRAGVARHRAVDAFSDRHAASRAARQRFPEGSRRFAGIFLDVLYDHYLSRHWARYCATPLPAFRREVYAAIAAHGNALPPGFAELAPHWAAADWLSAYASREGTRAVLERLVRRMRRPMPLAQMLAIAEGCEPLLTGDFLTLFDDLLHSFGSSGRRDLRLPAIGDAIGNQRN